MIRKLVTAALFFIGVAVLDLVYVRAEKAQTAAAATAQPQGSDSKVIAYYFHVTVRCTTCRAIEGYSREVVEQKFGAEIAKGRLQYKLVNVQLSENKHFVKDYQLFTKSLVLVRFDKGKQAEYKVLNDTWELVGDKPAMQAYVERELREYLKRLS
jgi:hypothetical protein